MGKNMSGFDLIKRLEASKAKKSTLKLPNLKFERYEIGAEDGDYLALVPIDLYEKFEDDLSLYTTITSHQLRTLLKQHSGIMRKL
jgi:hypothetical protein